MPSADERDVVAQHAPAHVHNPKLSYWLFVALMITTFGALIAYDLWPQLTLERRRARLHELAVSRSRWSDVEPILIGEHYTIVPEPSDSRRLVLLHHGDRYSRLYKLYMWLGSAARNESDATSFRLMAGKHSVGAVALRDGVIVSVDDPGTY
jgi:hypothetical protein